ncbi:phospholipase D-like domain-containing protein [Azotobacter armeniacus]
MLQREGVQVNLIRDSVGTLGTPGAFFTRLADTGINVLEFNLVNPLTAKAGWQVNQRELLIVVLCSLALLVMPLACAQDAVALKARHAALRAQLTSNSFQRPLHIESSQTAGTLKGDIYARFEQPYAVLGPTLQDIAHWCDILILHPYVKRCRTAAGDTLSLDIGRNFEQLLADAYPFAFRYRVVVAAPDYLHLALGAETGPLGTSRYRMVLEVVALDAQRSFLHMSYSYAYGLAARVAVRGYLATAGRDKVGFSIVGRKADGQPIHVGGMRAIVERNTMRYYLAIEAFLGALSTPSAEQHERRLELWHAGARRYPLQLQEPERDVYLEMKRKEILRQQAPGAEAQ